MQTQMMRLKTLRLLGSQAALLSWLTTSFAVGRPYCALTWPTSSSLQALRPLRLTGLLSPVSWPTWPRFTTSFIPAGGSQAGGITWRKLVRPRMGVKCTGPCTHSSLAGNGLSWPGTWFVPSCSPSGMKETARTSTLTSMWIFTLSSITTMQTSKRSFGSGQTVYTYRCNRCQKISQRNADFIKIILSFPQDRSSISLNELIHCYFEMEQLDDNFKQTVTIQTHQKWPQVFTPTQTYWSLCLSIMSTSTTNQG